MAAQHPDNPVGQFCYYHFSRIARLLRTQHPLYRRDLMPGQHRLPFWPALVSYLSFKSTALRNAARLGVTLAVGSSTGAVFNLPKPYWILLTIMLVSQNGYNATRVRIQHRALGTIAGLLLAAGLLQLQLPEGETLSIMLVITLLAYGFAQELRVVGDWLYGHGGLHPAAAGAERLAFSGTAPDRYADRLRAGVRRHHLAVAAVAKRAAAQECPSGAGERSPRCG